MFEIVEKWSSTTVEYYRYEALVALALIAIYFIYYLKYRSPHFLIKPVYDPKKKNMRKPLPPYPNGWYNVMKGCQLGPGKVRSADINGQNMVVYRGTDKVVYVLEAYCLHMGAHLGIGGQVVNSQCVQCPFHGWLYDGKTGHCVDHNGRALSLKSVQYNQSLAKCDGKLQWREGEAQKVKLRKYPVVEMNGYIYVWIHAMEEHSQTPIYPMIDVSSFLNHLNYRGQTEHLINCHMQDIPSNGADILHFKYVHTYIFPWLKSLYFTWQANWKVGTDPDIKSFFEHPRKEIKAFKQRVWKQLIEPYPNKEILSIGTLENDIHLPLLGKWFMFSATIIQVGLGIVFVVLKSPLYELVFHHYVVPQGRHQQQVFHDLYISNWIPYFVSSKIAELQGGQVTNDMYIWQSKTFARKCYLDEKKQTDDILKGWLNWSSQFYQGCNKQLKKEDNSW